VKEGAETCLHYFSTSIRKLLLRTHKYLRVIKKNFLKIRKVTKTDDSKMKKLLFSLIILSGLFCVGQDTTKYMVRFSTDESKLIKAQLKSLDSLMSNLDEPLNAFDYDIQGHTDNVGDRLYNLQLSEKRCQSIKDFLIKKGVKENRITFEKYSFDLPLAENTTDKGRASNRRATLTIVYKLENPDWRLKAQAFQSDADKEIKIKTKNGCKVEIPANAFQSSDLLPITGQVEIQITEYNNPADFIASGIPMSYGASGKLFAYHSYEMLNIKAFQNAIPLVLKDDVSIRLNCRGVDSLYMSGFYKFNLQEQKWFADEKTETVKVDGLTGSPIIKEEKKESKPVVEPGSRPEKKSEKLNDVIAIGSPTVSTSPLAVGSPTINEETKEIKPEEESTSKSEENSEKGDSEKGDSEKEDEKESSAGRADGIANLKTDTAWVFLKKIKIDTFGVYTEEGGPNDFIITRLDTMPHGRCCNSNDLCVCLKEHIAQGLKASEQPLATWFDTSGTKYFNERYYDFSYSGTVKIPPGTRMSNRKYYSIRLVTKKLFLRKSAIVKLKYDKENNPELRELKNINWKFRFKENSEDYASFKKRKFTDLRIEYDVLKMEATLELKGKEKFTTIKLKADDPDGKLVRKMQRYAMVLSIRKRRFDWLEHNRAIETVNGFYQQHYCFRDYRSHFFQDGRDLNLRNWISYFNAHRNSIHAQYDSLNKNIGLVQKKFCTDSAVCIDCGKLFLKGTGPNRLLVIRLGIYNYDDVIALEKTVSINSPIFFTSKGRKIRVKESFLILGGINGMIHLKPNSPLILVENYRNTLFIVDKSNRRFKVVIEAKENLNQHGNSFIMKNITKTTKNLEGLTKELMGK